MVKVTDNSCCLLNGEADRYRRVLVRRHAVYLIAGKGLCRAARTGGPRLGSSVTVAGTKTRRGVQQFAIVHAISGAGGDITGLTGRASRPASASASASTSARVNHQPVDGPLCANTDGFNEVREANGCDLRIEQSGPYCA